MASPTLQQRTARPKGPVPSWRRHGKRYLALVGLLIVAGWLLRPRMDLVTEVFRKMRERGYPAQLADIERIYAAIPEEQNALPTMIDCGEKMIRGDHLTWVGEGGFGRAISDAEVCTGVEALAGVADESPRLHSILRRPGAWYQDWINKSGNLAWGYAGGLLLRQARMLTATGEMGPALEALEDGWRWTEHLARTPTAIHQVVALDLRRQTLMTIAAIAQHRELSESELVRLSAWVTAWESAHGVAVGIQTEMILTTEPIRSGRFQSGLLRPTHGLNFVARSLYLHSGQLEYELIELLQDRLMVLDALALPLVEFPAAIARIRAVKASRNQARRLKLPRFLINETSDWALYFASREATLRAQSVVTSVGLAVERYRRQHREIPPAALSDLVPEYLPRLPADPFTGQPLHYLPTDTGFIVYSVGLDQNDDDGRAAPPESRSAKDFDTVDLVFSIKRAPGK